MVIKIGLIGYGNIAPFYLKAIEKNPNAKILAICDNDKSKKPEIQDMGYHYSDDYNHLINNDDIDAIIVAVPNYLHSQISIAALEAGKHVLCEKPMATNAKDAHNMVETAKREKRALMVAFHNRFNEQMQKLKSKNLDIVKFRAINFENVLEYYDPNVWYFNKNLSGGGCIIDMGINFIDVIYEFIHPLTIKKTEIISKKDGVELKAKLIFKQGELEIDWDSKETIKKIILISRNGDEHEINILDKEKLGVAGSYKFHEYKNLLKHFLDCLKNNTCYGERGLHIQKIIDKIYNQ